MPNSLQFQEFRLDLDRLCLYRPDGPASLRRKSFEVLRYLLEHPGRVVTKEELINAVWPDVVVGDESLTQCISEVRRALNGKGTKIIKTIARRGYLVDVAISPIAVRPSDTATSDDAPPSPRSNGTSRDTETPPARGAALPDPVGTAAQNRRQVTALVCRLEAAAHAGYVDPEDWSAVLAKCRGRMKSVVERHGGFASTSHIEVSHYLFGYPHAREDDAERAVHAGLALVQAVRELEFDCLAQPLRVRIGIATGVVVAGVGVEHGDLAVGDAPIIASLLLDVAAPGSVVIAGSTRRLVGSFFRYRDVRHEMDDRLTPAIAASEVLHRSTILSRLDALRTVDGALIGREEEIDALLRRWQDAVAGTGRVVLLTGEAGIGKSRLARALQDRLDDASVTQLAFHCSPNHQNTALYAITTHILHAASITHEDEQQAKRQKLEALLTKTSMDPGADFPLLEALLSVSNGSCSEIRDMSPQQLKERTLKLLVRQLNDLTIRGPVLLIFEDLHWCDPTTLELLSHIIDRAPELRLLLVATYRPEFAPPWAHEWHVSTIVLSRLGRQEGHSLVTTFAVAEPLPPNLIAHILDRADGIPLFIEELTKTVVESAGLHGMRYPNATVEAKSTPLIPATLHASLSARLDRLECGKPIAQIGSAIGREFSHQLMVAVSNHDEAQLGKGLDDLVKAGLVFQRGFSRDATYVFKHALVQDAAYQGLLKSEREQLHGRIADALVGQFSDFAATEPETVARHYTEAGSAAKALHYWQIAARRASLRSADTEAASHVTRALQIVDTLKQSPERDWLELDLLIEFSRALIASKGHAAPEVDRALRRALELAQRIGHPSKLFPILYQSSVYQFVSAPLPVVRKLAEEFLELVERQDEALPKLVAQRRLAVVAVMEGNPAAARKYSEQALALYDEAKHRSMAFVYGQDGRIASLSFFIVSLWYSGEIDQARDLAKVALDECAALGHANTSGQTIAFAGMLLPALCGNGLRLREAGDCLLALTREHRLPFWEAFGRAAMGRLHFMEGRPSEAIEALTDGIHEYEMQNVIRWRPTFLVWLAEVLVTTGQFERANRALDEAQQIIDDYGERWFASEVHRLRGELRQAEEPTAIDAIANHYARALEASRSCKARTLELRAATSLARLWSGVGKKARAREVLAPVLARMKEGLDTPDVEAARNLLEGIAATIGSSRFAER